MTTDPHARFEALEPAPAGSVLALWTELCTEWSIVKAQHFADRVDALFDAATGAQINLLGDLAAYFATFVETSREPNTAQRIRLDEMVQAAAGMRPAPRPPVSRRISAVPSASVPATSHASKVHEFPQVHSAPRRQPQNARNSVCLIGLSDALAPGLSATLIERGYDVVEFRHASAAHVFLRKSIPGAIVMLAPQLRALPSLQALWANSSVAPALVVLSPNRDLTHRLLSLRANAAGFFAAPLDSYRIVSRLDDLLGHQSQPPYRILIVQDDRELAVLCGSWVASEGMTARIATYGSAALAALGEFQPDLILMDARLPDARGLDLVQVIRQQPEHAMLPIVLTSTEGDAGERFDAIAAGADEVLVKPLKARHVIGVVRARVQRALWLRAQAEAGAARDPKSGLYPRSVLADRMPARFGTSGSVLFAIAIDDADLVRKKIGTSGLTALDIEVGQRLRELLQPHDMAGTLRDCTWMILVTRDRRESIVQLAEQIRFAMVERGLSVGNTSIDISVSIGLVDVEGGDWTVDQAVASAEQAIETAQKHGGNLATWFDGEAVTGPDPALAVRAVLSRSLDPRHIRVEYRPLVPLKGTLHGQFDLQFYLSSAHDSGARASYPVCARVASELGVRKELERLRLGHAMEVRRAARDERHALRLLMPMTADWVVAAGEVDWLLDALNERKLAGSGFTFELPSAEVLDRREQLQEPLARLRAAGVRIGLNDFGRDFAAVHVLTQLPVDTLRLDAEIVEAGIQSSAVNATILALVRKAHQLGAMVIAPTMDRPERAHILLRLGIDYGVGDAFGPATAQPEFDFSRPLW